VPRSLAALTCLAAVTLVATSLAATGRREPRLLEVDHLMLHVSPGAPERAALARAGFTVSPDLNEHEGQGSASVMVELANGFLELAWRDTSVRVEPRLEPVARRYERMSAWRSSGWSPLGIGLRRAPGAPDSLPFPTRSVTAPWMAPGDAIEIVSAFDDTLGPRLWVVPRSMAATGKPESESERRRLARPELLVHANGAHAITAVRVLVPEISRSAGPELIAARSEVVFTRGAGWLLEVTFDGGRRGIARDLRPELPLLCHF